MSEVSVPTAAQLVERGLLYRDVDDACREVQDALGVTDGGLAGQMLGEDGWRSDFPEYVVAERRGVLEELMSEPVPVPVPVRGMSLDAVITQCNAMLRQSKFRMTKLFMGGGLRSGCAALNSGYMLINDYMMTDYENEWAVGVWRNCDDDDPIRWFEGDLRMVLTHVEHFWIVREVLPGGSRG
jgi:hypothetical protein